MGQVPPSQTGRDTQAEGATYHRAPPSAPEGSCILHMLPGALFLGGAVALFFRGEALLAGKLVLGIELQAAEAFLAFVGAVFFAQGAAALLRALRRGLGAQFKPQGSWRWEWPWNPAGVDDRLAVKARERLVSVPIALAAMVPAGWILYTLGLHTDRRYAGLLLAPAAAELAMAIYYFALFKLRGRGRLEFHTYPFAIGGTLQARYHPTGRMLGYGPRMRATLRCLEVTGRGQGGQISARELWKWTEDAEIVGGKVEVVLDISAPAELATRFRRPARFWELEVGPWGPGAAGNATFIVPVYIDPSRPVAAPAAPPARRPATAQPAVQRPGTGQPAVQRPATGQPAAKRPATSQPAVQRPATDRPAVRRPASAVPATPREAPPSPPVEAEGPSWMSETPEEAPHRPPSSRLPNYPPVPVPRMEQPGASPTANPTPVGFAVEKVGERFRCELLLTPALAVADLTERVANAFEVTLEPLPGAEEGTFFGRAMGLDVALQAAGEGRRLVLGGTRPMDPGPGDASDRATEWAIAKLLMAGVAARRPE